jgi:hypothetical protein
MKGGKPDRTPPLFLWFKKSMQNLKENSQDYAQKPQRNCTFMNLASTREEHKTIYIAADLRSISQF